jgi:hypothetical protein
VLQHLTVLAYVSHRHSSRGRPLDLILLSRVGCRAVTRAWSSRTPPLSPSTVSVASLLHFLTVPTTSAAHSSISPVYRSPELRVAARVSSMAPHGASSRFLHRSLGGAFPHLCGPLGEPPHCRWCMLAMEEQCPDAMAASCVACLLVMCPAAFLAKAQPAKLSPTTASCLWTKAGPCGLESFSNF